MKTKTITLYDYNELSPKAKEKALREWNAHDDMPFLSDDIHETLAELLKKNGITAEGEPKVSYSLGYSQGDGAMFEGVFTWKNYRVSIKHSGRYYHSNSKDIEIETLKGAPAIPVTYSQFETIYQSICKELERVGYAHIEDAQSEEHFIDTCEANEYTFREDGTMENL